MSKELELLDTKSNLPVLAHPMPNLPVNEESMEREVRRADAEILAYTFSRVAEAWREAVSIDDVGKMVCLTSKLMKDRRDLLLMPYGSVSAPKKTEIVFPID